MPRVAVLSAAREPFTTSLDGDAVTIGRSESCDLVLLDPSVSRRHCRLRRDGEHWHLEDRESRHGLLLNGRRVERAERLEPGDRISLGRVVLVFEPPRRPHGLVPTDGRGASEEIRRRLCGNGPSMSRVRLLAERFAPSAATVLVQGETGTGKELLARLIHELSNRRDGPFVVVNCPALPATLVEAELFGTERGVATGVDPRPGLVEAADRGTLFLDEIGDLDPAAQAKILRFMQDRQLRRIGSLASKQVDVRVIAATHHDLPARVEAGLFRRDLYHRLEVATVELPPLRAHREDLDELIAHFLEMLGEAQLQLSEETRALFDDHDWPGNVRELEHALQRGALLATGGLIRPDDLPRTMRGDRAAAPGAADAASRAAELRRRVIGESACFWETVRTPYLARELSRDAVRIFIERLLDECGGSYHELSKRLGCHDRHRKLMDFLRNNSLRPDQGGEA